MSSDADFAPLVFATIPAAATASSAQTEYLDRAAEQAQVRGHAAGYAMGLRAATAAADERLQLLEAAHVERAARREAKLDQAIDAMTAAMNAVARTVMPVVAEADNALLSAAIELAEAVIARELADTDDGAAAALRRVLAGLGSEIEQPGLTVRMHPSDAAALADTAALPATLTILADSRLSPGDAIAELEDGLIDARIGAALQRAKLALAGEER